MPSPPPPRVTLTMLTETFDTWLARVGPFVNLAIPIRAWLQQGMPLAHLRFLVRQYHTLLPRPQTTTPHHQQVFRQRVDDLLSAIARPLPHFAPFVTPRGIFLRAGDVFHIDTWSDDPAAQTITLTGVIMGRRLAVPDPGWVPFTLTFTAVRQVTRIPPDQLGELPWYEEWWSLACGLDAIVGVDGPGSPPPVADAALTQYVVFGTELAVTVSLITCAAAQMTMGDPLPWTARALPLPVFDHVPTPRGTMAWGVTYLHETAHALDAATHTLTIEGTVDGTHLEQAVAGEVPFTLTFSGVDDYQGWRREDHRQLGWYAEWIYETSGLSRVVLDGDDLAADRSRYVFFGQERFFLVTCGAVTIAMGEPLPAPEAGGHWTDD